LTGIDGRRGSIPKGLMQPLLMVKGERVPQTTHGLWDALVILEIDLLVLDRAP